MDTTRTDEIKYRISEIDGLKCIGIILVVAFHSGSGMQRFYTLFFYGNFFCGFRVLF